MSIQTISQLKIYTNCKIVPDKNFYVDSITAYLQTLNPVVISNFQYVKHGLNISIKIDLSQDQLDPVPMKNANYVSIQNMSVGDGQFSPQTMVFYFVKRKRWIAPHTIEYELVCDTINSFRDTYEVSPKTKILRQHKDRWEYKEVNGQNGRYKIIDLYSEGITPVLYGEEKRELREDIDINWYLVYMNQNEPSESLSNPVNCFLASDNYINVADQNFDFTDFSLTLNQIKTWLLAHRPYSLYFIGANNKGASCSTTTMTEKNSFEWYLNDNNELWERYIDETGVYYTHLENLSLLYVFDTASTLQYGSANNQSSSARTYSPAPDLPTKYCYTIDGINQYDKTDPRIIKIIKLPYCPLDFDFARPSGTIDITTGRIIYQSWQFSTPLEQPKYRRWQLNDLNTKFERTIDFQEFGKFNPYDVLKGLPYTPHPSKTALKSADNEPKLLHSDFYLPKVVYDSFGFGFQMERITHQFSQIQPNFKIKYLCTSTINSKFSFTFTDYECSPYSAQDYNNVMCVAVNNEVPIYNQQYINYLRAGFNYDVKTKQRTETFAWLGAGLQVAGAVASFASSVYTGGFGIAGGIAFTTSAMATIASAINTTMTAEQNLQQKQDQLKLQATSVYGSDDVDIRSGYTNNRAKVILYQASPKMRQLLFDLFHYTGYIAGHMGVPDRTSRTRFNFVSAEIVFTRTPNIPDDIIDDIKQRYLQGITFLHHYNNEWDFEQIYENWETSLEPV